MAFGITAPAGLEFQEFMREMARRKKDDKPPSLLAGAETAVVYEDELPWNKGRGICFEIKEVRKLLMDVDAVEYTWVVRFTPAKELSYTRRMVGDYAESSVDNARRDARLDILYRAHRDGVI